MKKKEFIEKNTGKDRILGRPIKCNRQTLQVNPKGYSEVIFIGDLHYGSPQSNVKKFLRMLDYCLKKKVYLVLMGDILETATKTSVAAGWAEQEYVLQKQYEDVVGFLTPLAEKGLILGYVQGNHEQRIWVSSGLDICKLICRELKVPYLGGACWNLFKVGKQHYSVYTLHGRTAAQSDGTVLTVAKRLAYPFYCDVFAMAHAHRCVDGIGLAQYVELKTKMVKEKRKIVMITGSYLDYGGYWQDRGGEISKIGSPKIKFFSEDHQTHISW